jgi:hypothetical protein
MLIQLLTNDTAAWITKKHKEEVFHIVHRLWVQSQQNHFGRRLHDLAWIPRLQHLSRAQLCARGCDAAVQRQQHAAGCLESWSATCVQHALAELCSCFCRCVAVMLSNLRVTDLILC